MDSTSNETTQLQKQLLPQHFQQKTVMPVRQQLPGVLRRLLSLQQHHKQHHQGAVVAAGAAWLCGSGSAGYSAAAALPQLAEEDELAVKAGKALEEITAAGTLKVERQITTPQAASVGECCAGDNTHQPDIPTEIA